MRGAGTLALAAAQKRRRHLRRPGRAASDTRARPRNYPVDYGGAALSPVSHRADASISTVGEPA
jgi:hypothetical protein